MSVLLEYQFRQLGKTCAGTGRPLAPGQDVVSILVERGGEIVRLDYARDAWPGPPKGTIGQWKCQVPPAAEVNASRIDPELLLQFFEQLLETANPAHDRLLYVLSLYLLQRRRLKLEGTRIIDDVACLELIGSRGEGPYVIRDQQLPEDEVRRTQGELNRHLSELGARTDAA